jgi:predicted nuclease of predicted toxin-antitoxin system
LTSFPGSNHVRSVAPVRASDEAIWRHALGHGFAIVTKDSDFHEWAQVSNPYPKIVWIRRANCSTSDVEAVLHRHRDDDPGLRYLTLV